MMVTISVHREPPSTALPPPADVDVWLIDFAAPWRSLPALRELLSPAERLRAERYTIARARHQSIVSRGSLRYLLSCYKPDYQLLETSLGKPYMAGMLYHFSVAHSGDCGIIAVANQRIGVDLEQLRDMPNAAGLVQRFFHSREQLQFAQLPQELKSLGFFRGWTGKEALLKAVGVGLADLESCAVDLEPRQPANVVHFTHQPAAGQEWHLTTWSAIDGYLASIAMETEVNDTVQIREV